MLKRKLFLLYILLAFFQSKSIAQYDVGVFYMPFWYYANGNSPTSGNWGMIDNYVNWQGANWQGHESLMPQNIYAPSAQWYDEKQQHVVEKQHELMSENGIDFVIYDTYFERRGNNYGSFWSHAIDNVKKTGFNHHDVDFAISWWNDFLKLVHGGYCDEFLRGGGLDSMASFMRSYMQSPNYKTKNGKPMLFIGYPGYQVDPTYGNGIHTNSLEGLCGLCQDDPFFAPTPGGNNEPYINHRKTKYFLEVLENKIGLGALHYVLVMWGVDGNYNQKYDWMVRHPNEAGFDAVTSYGYKQFWPSDASFFYNYSTMQNVHKNFYDYMLNSNRAYLNNNNLKYYVPVSSGWNRAPFNKFECDQGTYPGDCNLLSMLSYKNFLGHDNAVSTPNTWGLSLSEAKNRVDSRPSETDNTVVLCCWNEYAEGTVIEPTTKWGKQYLQKVETTFGPSNDSKLSGPNLETKNPFALPFPNGAPYSISGVEEPLHTAVPSTIYPNPGKDKLTITYHHKKTGQLHITILDLLGAKVTEVLNTDYTQGNHAIPVDITKLPTGTYLMNIKTITSSDVVKFQVQK